MGMLSAWCFVHCFDAVRDSDVASCVEIKQPLDAALLFEAYAGVSILFLPFCSI